VVARPVDKRENYVKRCVAMPGDVLQVINGELFINEKQAFKPEKMQYSYFVSDPTGIGLSSKKRKALNINEEDIQKIDQNTTVYWLNEDQKTQIEKLGMIVEKIVDKENAYDMSIFPHDSRYHWNKDNFGPIVIPQKGQTVEINDSTIVLYDKIIKNYELNDLQVKDGKVYINGQVADSYTFQMDYYFMMGDNRHNSADSRFWGFVPENHIVGRTLFVWLSLDKFKTIGEGKIRWSKMFKKIK
jgi:signal peptidase I